MTDELESAFNEWLNEVFWQQPMFAMPTEQREREREREGLMLAFKAGAECERLETRVVGANLIGED